MEQESVMMTERLEELKTIRSDLRGNVELLVRTDDGECSWEYGRELLEELLDAEIERLSVMDEEISQVLSLFEDDETFLDIEYGEVVIMDKGRKIIIQALKDWQPVRENRTTEPCEWCEGNTSKYFDVNWYDFTATNTGARPKAKFCPFCGRDV